jgi:glycosyltransferase involved in cell wall biosynthesis
VGNVQAVLAMTKACVIIPSYNVAKTIGPIVYELRKQNLDVLVVDDGSTDSTSEAADKNGAIVLKNQVNRGKGDALRRGLQYAADKGYDALITMDGDGQHSPEDVINFLKAQAIHPEAGLIIGNRMQCPRGMPILRLLTNRIMSTFISWLCRQHIPDSQNGFRLIKRQSLQEMKLKSSRFEIESEIILEAARIGAKIISIPICPIYKGHPSSISPLLDTLRFIRFSLPYLRSQPGGES